MRDLGGIACVPMAIDSLEAKALARHLLESGSRWLGSVYSGAGSETHLSKEYKKVVIMNSLFNDSHGCQ